MGQVISLEALKSVRETLRQQGKKVVFTNGCYDILHRGHVEYLNRAKALGDILIVGVNMDASVKRLKGDLRPIVTEDDRSFIIANLAAVDYACLFGEDTPFNIIRELVPDVLVKGADWKVDDIVGKDIVEGAGGVVRTIEFVPSKSTTNVIDEVIKRYK